MISVRGEKPKYIRKDTKNKRGYIKYHTTVEGKKKSINGHALTAIIFKSCVMPDAQKELPYEGAKEMLLVDNVDNREFMCNLLRAMYDELPAAKK